MVVEDAIGGSSGDTIAGLVVVSSVVTVLLTGAGSGPHPESKEAPAIRAKASPRLKRGDVMMYSVWFELNPMRS